MMISSAHFRSDIAGPFRVLDQPLPEGFGIRQLIFDSQPDAEQSAMYVCMRARMCVRMELHCVHDVTRDGCGSRALKLLSETPIDVPAWMCTGVLNE